MKLFATLLLLTFGFSTNLFCQCTINQNAFVAGDYGIVPDSSFNSSPAATATELSVYNTVFQLHFEPDTATQLGTFPITWVRIDSITGLPSGITWASNPSGTMPAYSHGCLSLDGTPVVGSAAGGPNNDGNYPITIHTTQEWVIFSVPTEFPIQLTDYRMRVEGSTNGLSEATKSPMLSVAYNGTDASATLTSTFAETKQASIVDMNGKHQQSLLIHPGNNPVEISSLKPGIYLVQTDSAIVRIVKL
ncbi:MAG: T9SS type A sorting domain-containing protein [Bacteroidota bacterium]